MKREREHHTRRARVRRGLSWLLLPAGAAFVGVSVAKSFTADPQEGEGWAGGVIEAIFGGGPLLAIGLGLRSERIATRRRIAVAAPVLAVVVGFVLVMQLLDANERTSNRLLNAAAMCLYLLAAVVEIGGLLRRGAPDSPGVGERRTVEEVRQPDDLQQSFGDR